MKKIFNLELNKKVVELLSLISGDENLAYLEKVSFKLNNEDWGFKKRWLFLNKSIALIQLGLDIDESLDLAIGFAIE